MSDELPGGPNRRCDGCGNATTATRLAPAEPVLCAFCTTRLDTVQMEALAYAGWAYADPSSTLNGEQRDTMRRSLRVAHLRLLLERHEERIAQ
jgi:hypothetical protein